MLLSSLQDYRLGHFTDETRAFLKLLRQSGDVCEIRAPNCPHRPGGDFRSTHSGYFSSLTPALKEIERLTKLRPPGIYMTLNPVRRDFLARSANKITPKAKHTTADEDIDRRDWLFIDIDSKRPAGISATDAQVEATQDLAEHIRTDLAAEGWPDALLCMSGNGAYLLYRIELSNDEWAEDLIKRTLQGLANRYDTEAAEIDCKTYNASRIIKVMGTWARKGSDLKGQSGIEDRPHRKACYEPPRGPLNPVARDLLEAVSVPKDEPKPNARPQQDASSAHVPRGSSAFEQCITYLSKCPPAESGNNGHGATFRAACEIARFGLAGDEAMDAMRRFNETQTIGEQWSEAELRHKLEDTRKEVESKGEFGCRNKPAKDGHEDTRHLPVGTQVRAGDRGNIGTIVSDNGAVCTVHFVSPEGQQADKELPKSQLRPLNGTGEPVSVPPPENLTALIKNHPKLRPPVVHNLLRRTEIMNLVAAPKTGKSWLVANLGLCVANGQPWLGSFPCEQGRVLFIDGELHPETIADRLPVVAKGMNLETDCFDRIDVLTLRGFGVDLTRLREKLQDLASQQYDLVILDAWYRFLPLGTNENDNAAVMALYNLIDQYAAQLNAAWVNVHHASKGDQSEKSTTDVGSGAGSQSRAADTHLTIRPHEEDGVSVVTGVVRSWRPFDDFCIRRRQECPVWDLADDAHPGQFRRPQSPKEAAQQVEDEKAMATIEAQLRVNNVATKKMLRGATGISKGKLDRLMDRLMDRLESEGRVHRRETKKRGQTCDEYVLSHPGDDDKQGLLESSL